MNQSLSPQISNKRVTRIYNRVLQHLTSAALYAKTAIGCGNAMSSIKKTPTHRATVVAEAKLYISCLRGNDMFRKCRSSSKCGKDECHKSHNTSPHGAERVCPVKSLTNILNNSKSKICSRKPYFTGHRQPSKTFTFSSATKFNGLLHVTELQLTSFSGANTTALVLCDNAKSNSWVFDSLAVTPGLQGTALKLYVKGTN